jgi:hypothetical protein
MRVVRYTMLLCVLVLLTAAVDGIVARRGSAAMKHAADAFLAGLEPAQRTRAQFAFADAERLNWHFVPRERRGLPLKEMTPPQRDLARRLLQAGLSQRGMVRADTIMALELVLRELGQNPNVRDPERYFFSIFGTPSDSAPWGWRVEGHHLALNFTIFGGRPVATSPSFMGANPAEVRTGSRRGLRALAPEEDLARELVASLNASQLATAIIATEAPREIMTGNAVEVDALAPPGIAVGKLERAQAALLLRVVDEYLSRMSEPLAAERRTRLERSDFSQITFAWAGSTERGQPHYYRIQGPSFLIEYDNTQNDANHVHTVWRDFAGDFGRDLLREHYRSAPHPN